MSQEKRCGDCIFWDGKGDAAAGTGPVCRKNPPVAVPFTSDTAYGVQSGLRAEFPPMEESDWCHEFKSQQTAHEESMFRYEVMELIREIEANTRKEE